MLSAPVKQAKRISSLFSLVSRDRDSSHASPSASEPSSAAPSPRPSMPADARTSPLAPGPIDDLALGGDLPPPPSLLAINSDLADSDANGRPRSRGRRRNGSESRGRPSSATGLAVPRNSSEPRSSSVGKRRSWIPGKTRVSSAEMTAVPMRSAWIAGLDQRIAYDFERLARGAQIPELWNEQGDTFVYLFPQSTGRPPSFRVDSSVFAESPSLTFLARGTDAKSQTLDRHMRSVSLSGASISPVLAAQDRRLDHDFDNDDGSRNLLGDDAPDDDVPELLHLYLPIPLNSDVSTPQSSVSAEDTQSLLLFRNLFAFLMGQSLVATPRSPTLFSIFMDVATLLARFEFSNLDGSNFGETATSSFSNYCDELHLADVRRSREKTIEAIVLGERLRFYPLYLEGFVHGVGKLDEIKQLRSPKYSLIHPVTQKRLERGFIDLDSRLRVLYSKLEDFDFPSMWSGVANSTKSAESKVVRFKAWRAAFLEFRKFMLQYLRQKYGSWPPKAGSKKNSFEESGLNRLLLRDLYDDCASLYDLLVDRSSLTTRTVDLPMESSDTSDAHELTIRALRQILSEYDCSTPPVLPPIPFDLPQIPSLASLKRKPVDAKKEAKQRTKKLKDVDINAVLMDSYTKDSIHPTEWIESFMQFERRSAHGKSIDDLIDLRIGQWIFLYAVIQSLPMLVVDVGQLRYTDGVEYFLCVAPRGGAPWINNDSKSARSWFGVAGGAGVVSLPTDMVINGVEGVYRRSHCWQVAEQWLDKTALLDQQLQLPQPPSFLDDNYDNDSVISSPFQTHQSSADSSTDPSSSATATTSPITAASAAAAGAGASFGHSLSPSHGGTPKSSSPGFGPRATEQQRHSFYPGLEALPLPAGVAPMDPPSRPMSRSNPTMSFDDILKEVPRKAKK